MMVIKILIWARTYKNKTEQKILLSWYFQNIQIKGYKTSQSNVFNKFI